MTWTTLGRPTRLNVVHMADPAPCRSTGCDPLAVGGLVDQVVDLRGVLEGLRPDPELATSNRRAPLKHFPSTQNVYAPVESSGSVKIRRIPTVGHLASAAGQNSVGNGGRNRSPTGRHFCRQCWLQRVEQ